MLSGKAFVNLIILLSSTYPVSCAAEVTHNSTTFHGTLTSGIEHFQNIRYAKPPTGPLRFAPPEPYTPAENIIIDATAPGPACPQSKAAMPPFLSEIPEISEDCLNLRIARPEGTKATDKLPVIVWVHTGGVVKGSAYDPHFAPDNLVTRSVELGKPVLYVAINYRLTIFGFARLAKLEKEKSLNVGMRDQRMAFEWVRRNIAAFGGDPESVTAFGLSAGGTMTGLQMIAYGGEQGVPFDRAWMMSGPPGTAVNMSSDAAIGHTLAVAERLECAGDDEEQVQCLREVPMEKLLDVAIEYSVQNFPPAGLFTFIPCVDGDMFLESATEMYRKGKFMKGIPTVLGWTENDGAMQTGPANLITSEEDMAAAMRVWAPALTPSEMSALLELYPAEDFASTKANFQLAHPESPLIPIHWFRLSQVMRDVLFTCPSIDFASHNARFSREGHEENEGSFDDVYLYVLNQTMLTPLFEAVGMSHLGVCHGSDTNYIFNGVFPEGEVLPKDKELASDFSAKLIGFARGETPGLDHPWDRHEWPQTVVPGEIGIEVVGGPQAGSVMLRFDNRDTHANVQMNDQQHIIYGDMDKRELQLRSEAVGGEKLLERCALFHQHSDRTVSSLRGNIFAAGGIVD